MEEAEARRGKLRKLRVLMFKHEMRAKHIKKIKSRAFHKANKKKKGNAGKRRFSAPLPNFCFLQQEIRHIRIYLRATCTP